MRNEHARKRRQTGHEPAIAHLSQVENFRRSGGPRRGRAEGKRERARGAPRSRPPGKARSDSKRPPASGRESQRPRTRTRPTTLGAFLALDLRLKITIVGTLLVVLSFVVLGGVIIRFASLPGPHAAAPIEIDVPSNAEPAEVATALYNAGATDSPTLMSLYLRFTSVTAEPGMHLVDGGSTPRELATLLRRVEGRAKQKLVIPEGFNMFAIGERLQTSFIASRTEFLKACRDETALAALGIEVPAGSPLTAEGYLFPATYEFPRNTPAHLIVERLVTESNRRWKKLADEHERSLAAFAHELGWTRHHVVTMASIVEREAANDEERPLVASVFLNRLTRDDFEPKLLQSDPTSAYDCYRRPTMLQTCAGFDGKTTPAMNRDKANEYSTYVRTGLPPGPIANPGAASLRAVLDPAQTNHLYFVAKNGKSIFTDTYEEHKKAIAK